MKRILGLGLLVGLFSLSLLAAKNSEGFLLPTPVRVGDVVLTPGHCEVSWTEASGGQVQLTIKTDKKTVTVPARMVKEKQQKTEVLTTQVNGVTYLQELDTRNARFIIQAPTDAK